MREFLAMGGYAVWVWSAFGLALVVLVANIVSADLRFRQAVRRLRSRAGRAGSARR